MRDTHFNGGDNKRRCSFVRFAGGDFWHRTHWQDWQRIPEHGSGLFRRGYLLHLAMRSR
jgi:hypothetical protein